MANELTPSGRQRKVAHLGSASTSSFSFDSLIGGRNSGQLELNDRTPTSPEIDSPSSLLLRELESLITPPPPNSQASVSSKSIKDRPLGEALFDACAEVKVITSSVSMHLSNESRQKLFNQIDMMHEIDGWDPEDNPVDGPSYSTFLKWLLVVAPKKGPGLGLSHSGNVVAAWMHNKDRLIVEFLPKDKSKWSITRHCDGEVERGFGEANILRLLEVLGPYEVECFFRK